MLCQPNPFYQNQEACPSYTIKILFFWNIWGANYANFNLAHRINIQGEGRMGWEGDLQKCDYPIKRQTVNCKITQSSIPLGCWSGGLNWSLHGLYGEIGLHLIYSYFFRAYLILAIHERAGHHQLNLNRMLYFLPKLEKRESHLPTCIAMGELGPSCLSLRDDTDMYIYIIVTIQWNDASCLNQGATAHMLSLSRLFPFPWPWPIVSKILNSNTSWLQKEYYS